MSDDERRRFIEEEKLRRSMQGKSTGVAILLSVLFPGLGDLYCGSSIEFVLFAALNFICFALMLLGLGFLLFPFVWLAGIVSAVLSASRTRKGALDRPERAVLAG